MHNTIGIDIREVGTEVQFKEYAGDYLIIAKDNSQSVKMRMNYNQFYKALDDLFNDIGEKTRTELEEENLLQKSKIEELEDIVEQYREYSLNKTNRPF